MARARCRGAELRDLRFVALLEQLALERPFAYEALISVLLALVNEK